MTAAAPRRKLSERHPPETAAEPSRNPAPTNPAVPTGDKIAAALWDDVTPEFPALAEGKVDLVDELETILRGDFCDPVRPAPVEAVDPLDPEVNAASLAGHFTPAAPVAEKPARKTVATAAPDAPVLPRAKGLAVAPATARKAASALPVKASGFDLTTVEDPCDDPPAPVAAGTSAFWKVGDRIPIEQPAPPRVRNGIRSDIVIILVLALLIAGGGAYSAFRDWSASPSAPVDTEIARADVGALGVVTQPTTPEAAAPAEVIATAPAPLLGEMPLPGETPAPALTPDPVLAEAPRVPQEPLPGTRTVETLTIPIGTQLANTGTATPTTTATQPRTPVTTDPVLAYAPTEPTAATPFDEAASLAAQPRQQAATPPRNPNPAGGTVNATARTWVNMRAGPDNTAAVITVVAAGATVDVVACNFWCEVVYNGQTGWIYQDYLDGAPR